MNPTASVGWWRPDAGAAAIPPAILAPAGRRTHGRLAYRALLAFTFVLVLSPQEWIPVLGALRIALLAGLVAAAAHLIDRWQRPEPWRTPPEFVLAGCLLAWTIVTVPLSLWPGGSVAYLTDLYLKSLIVFWLLGRIVNTAERLYRLGWLLCLASVPVALTGLVNFGAGEFVGQSARIQGYGTGLAGNPNDLALTLALLLPLTLALLVSARSMLPRAAAAASALLSVACVVATFSRGGFIALAVVAVLGFAWVARRYPLSAGSAALAALLVAPPLLPEGYAERVSTTFDVEADRTGSAQERVRDMKAAVQLIQEHPIVGAGLGMDVLALNQARGATWRSVHDVYLQYGVDLGLIGMTLFVLLLGSSIRTAWRAEQRARAPGIDPRVAAIAGAVRISLVAFAVAALFYPVAYYFYFYYLAGLAVSLRTTTRSSQP